MQLKNFSMALMLGFGVSCAWAGSISASMVPAEVKNAFAQQYPSAQVMEWDFEDDENAYEVEARLGQAENQSALSGKRAIDFFQRGCLSR